MDKYKELFEYGKYVFNEEINRFARVDSKASMYLTALTLLFGLLPFMYEISINTFGERTKNIDTVGFGLFGLYFLILTISWLKCFRVIRISIVNKMPFDDKAIQLFDKYNLIDIHYSLSRTLKKALEENYEITSRKSTLLGIGYRFFQLSIYLLFVWFILVLSRKLFY